MTAVFCDHRQRPLREITKIVCKVCIDPVHHGFMREATVLAEWHLSQEEIPDLIRAILVREFAGRNHVARRLRHLLSFAVEEAMAEHALWQRQPRGHKESRPIHRVKAGDILADDMHLGGPAFLPSPGADFGEARCRDVVCQRIHPDINDMAGRIGYWDAPVKRRA